MQLKILIITPFFVRKHSFYFSVFFLNWHSQVQNGKVFIVYICFQPLLFFSFTTIAKNNLLSIRRVYTVYLLLHNKGSWSLEA